jgi:predicted nucleic acid-binding protein
VILYADTSLLVKHYLTEAGSAQVDAVLTAPTVVGTAVITRAEVLSRIQRPAIHGRMKDMLEFDGHVIYRAYKVDLLSVQAAYEVHEERFV